MEESESIWSYIPIADFDAPTPPATDAARGKLRRAWKFVQRTLHRSKPSAAKETLHQDRPVDHLLESVSPPPDWTHAANQLADTLGEDWFRPKQSRRRIQPLVGPPGCDVSAVLQQLAQHKQLRTLAAPALHSLLETPSDDQWAAKVLEESNREILVIPHLEDWYLRHEQGLMHLRLLLQQLLASQNRVLIGCDSWAWAFLQHAIGIESVLGPPLTLAPLDAGRLDRWFRSTLPLSQYAFRQSGNEQPIFPELPDAGRKKRGDKSVRQVEIPDFLYDLAVKSRGNPGVAQATWNASLRTRDPRSETSPTVSAESSHAFWLVSPNELTPPQLPLNGDRVHLFILHALLLHGGLSLSSLLMVLPFSRDEIQRRISELCGASILEEQDEELRVTLLAYPIVRRDLQSEGFLTDAC